LIGANNGSSACFIQSIAPQFVVFSDYQHPTKDAATRSMAAGVPVDRIFRTDFGDDEPGTFESKHGSISGCRDHAGDDDVETVPRLDRSVEVDYLGAPNGCDSRIES
jgi:hypothetical protein